MANCHWFNISVFKCLFYNSVHWKLTPLFFVHWQMSDGKFWNVSDIHWFASFIFVDFVCHFSSILLLHSVLFETNSRKGIFLSLFVTDLKSWMVESVVLQIWLQIENALFCSTGKDNVCVACHEYLITIKSIKNSKRIVLKTNGHF